MPLRLRTLACSLSLLSAACTPEPAVVATPPQLAPTTPSSATPEPAAVSGIDTAGIDAKVLPGDDFFRHANGAWLAANEIPADRSGWGTSAIVAERTAKRV